MTVHPSAGRGRRGSALLLSLLVAACGGSDDPGPTEPPGGPPENVAPVASFVVERSGPAAPVGATFDASPSSDVDGTIVSYEWSFGDNTTATGRRVEKVFDRPGTFLVLLTVTDEDGARGTESTEIVVEELGPDDLAGVIWWDRNGDGARQPGENGFPGMRVFLDDDGDGERDEGEETTTTSVGGIYSFSGLEPGEYRVTQELSIGWTNTVPGPGVTADGAPRWKPAGIVGGRDAPADSFPFMASMQIASEPDTHDALICGGSLIAPQWVMTASHCLSDSQGQPFPDGFLEVLLGTQRLDGSGVRVAIEETVLNPGYSPAGGFYKRDLSLVRLAERFDTRPRVFLMDSTAFTASVAPPDAGTLIGWGRNQANQIPVVLQTAQIPIRPRQDCVDAWNTGELERFEQTMLCAGPPGGTPTACSGDSGGPWMFPYRGVFHQLGVVSWGVATCGSPLGPAVYASVPAMMAFIEEHVPTEPSGAILVTLDTSGGRADFGNFH